MQAEGEEKAVWRPIGLHLGQSWVVLGSALPARIAPQADAAS
jgi:hypothetical protein